MKEEGWQMVIFMGIVFLVVAISLIYAAFSEMICIYRNPFPLFRNKDKRFGEIDKYKTRSILKDMKYDI
ncbi:MAG: hypothetical protein J1E64_05040 [Acetatifactor sp.]|nr:hypothetical protein [Acetatifactor sp.]